MAFFSCFWGAGSGFLSCGCFGGFLWRGRGAPRGEGAVLAFQKFRRWLVLALLFLLVFLVLVVVVVVVGFLEV